MNEQNADNPFASPDRTPTPTITIPIPGGGGIVDVTQAVFSHFVTPVVGPHMIETDVTPVMEAACALLEVEPKDGRRIRVYKGKILWLVENESGRRTLMFPEDA